MKPFFSLAMAWALSLAVNAATVSFSGITSTNSVKTNDLLLVDSALGGTNYVTRTATIATLQSALSIPTVPTGLVSNSVAQSGLLAVGATKTNGIAATFAHVTNALGYLPATNGATIATAANWVASGTTNSTLSGAATIGGNLLSPTVIAGQYQTYFQTITHAGTTTIDLSATNAYYMAITGNVTYAFSNIATNRTFTIITLGTSSNATITLASGATNFGSGIPSTYTAGRLAMIQGIVVPPGSGTTNLLMTFTETQ